MVAADISILCFFIRLTLSYVGLCGTQASGYKRVLCYMEVIRQGVPSPSTSRGRIEGKIQRSTRRRVTEVILGRCNHLNILVINLIVKKMKVKVLGDKNAPAVLAAHKLLRQMGHCIVDGAADLAIAPLLTVKLSNEELNAPLLGTLVFHPSPLPYGRGASAIRWAYRRKEPITAATWFWANERLDAGDICEQEVVKIDYSISPREFYHTHIIPAMLRTLERCLNALAIGLKRQVKQIEEYASYDGRIE